MVSRPKNDRFQKNLKPPLARECPRTKIRVSQIPLFQNTIKPDPGQIRATPRKAKNRTVFENTMKGAAGLPCRRNKEGQKNEIGPGNKKTPSGTVNPAFLGLNTKFGALSIIGRRFTHSRKSGVERGHPGHPGLHGGSVLDKTAIVRGFLCF